MNTFFSSLTGYFPVWIDRMTNEPIELNRIERCIFLSKHHIFYQYNTQLPGHKVLSWQNIVMLGDHNTFFLKLLILMYRICRGLNPQPMELCQLSCITQRIRPLGHWASDADESNMWFYAVCKHCVSSNFRIIEKY